MTAISRASVLAALAAWAGVGRWWAAPIALAVFALLKPNVFRGVDFWIAASVFALGLVAGWNHALPPDPLPPGPITVEGRVQLDLGARWGWSGLVATPAGTILVRADAAPPATRVQVVGTSDGEPLQVVGRWASATVDAVVFDPLAPRGLHERIADRFEERIVAEIAPGRSTARGLLVGFLIGDTAGVHAVVSDEMRRAGLSHLVAVSGSNVALFLVGLVVVTAPLSMRPSGRIFVLLNGLLVFGSLTRWEPSVVRAAAMAGLVALGRFVGMPLEPVTALAVVSGAGVLVAPGLYDSVGFQLSVLATGGLMLGVRWGAGKGKVGTALTATVAAQMAVAPLLLAVFGTVPLLSPLANLAAIPIVTIATALAGAGAALGAGWMIVLAEGLAAMFVLVARVAAPWPQLDVSGFGLVVLAVGVWWRLPRGRPALAVVAGALAAFSLLPGPSAPETGVVFFDVGQGDSALVRLSGYTILVDGGSDAARLAASLTRHGISRIDLVVATHVHEDHVAGLAGILDRIPVERIWAAFDPHETPSSRAFLAAAATAAVPVERPMIGRTIERNGDRVEVIGPRRRYAGPNDQSIVLVADIGATTVLLAGDIETVAQAELAVAGVDVLKVPHQGAATSDARWLAAHAGDLAVVSVGPNDFGHPSDWVLEVLEESGARVLRTDEFGDVVLEADGHSGLALRGSDAG